MVNDDYQADDTVTVIMVVIGFMVIYLIVRMLLNKFKGKDELDGLL
ncbi:hypothetical protein SAMN05428947_10471 [Mucilaginibacter sp. OK283]|jgi:hypothetical protein|nr:hypothetical protein SAMN05428947_10471 [Mucilaginibacter sp. OK283]